ncbi:MAG: hypothetical protein LLF76_02825 [Planctomycetaceae bacterium]|nr:hypothetical protein [Planctomycetaceae bacterium]
MDQQKPATTEQVNRMINRLLDELEVPENMREDLFQEAWVAHLEARSVRSAILRSVDSEKFYKKVFGR